MFGGGQFDPSGLTALVLDDNHYERGISLDQLRAMGFGRVIGAANTVEAWQALRGNNPNIVLMEWIDDANDGLDFVRRVRDERRFAEPRRLHVHADDARRGV